MNRNTCFYQLQSPSLRLRGASPLYTKGPSLRRVFHRLSSFYPRNTRVVFAYIKATTVVVAFIITSIIHSRDLRRPKCFQFGQVRRLR